VTRASWSLLQGFYNGRMSLFEFGIHRDVDPRQARNQALCFGANGRIDKPALRHFMKLGQHVQMDVRNCPKRHLPFEGHRRGDYDFAGRRSGQSQFLSKRQSEAGGVSDSKQFSRVGITIFLAGNPCRITDSLQHAALDIVPAPARAPIPTSGSFSIDQFHYNNVLPEKNYPNTSWCARSYFRTMADFALPVGSAGSTLK